MNEYHLFDEKEERSLLAAFAWWEKRRLIYNLIVGATGIICLAVLSLFSFLGLSDLVGILIYGIIVNLFYSCGFLIEIASRHYFKSKIDFSEKRKILFGIGLVLSILITIILSFGYAFILSSPF
ncbi:MAG: hypothetical protein JNK27_12700 [Chitinophagaceae bacterium]|nr:hypothetical protein [Chitinophagaceae bacterium]